MLGRLPAARVAEAGGGGRTASDADASREANVDLRRVVAGLAHDLRNPMTTIKTFAGSLAELPADDDCAAPR